MGGGRALAFQRALRKGGALGEMVGCPNLFVVHPKLLVPSSGSNIQHSASPRPASEVGSGCAASSPTMAAWGASLTPPRDAPHFPCRRGPGLRPLPGRRRRYLSARCRRGRMARRHRSLLPDAAPSRRGRHGARCGLVSFRAGQDWGGPAASKTVRVTPVPRLLCASRTKRPVRKDSRVNPFFTRLRF